MVLHAWPLLFGCAVMAFAEEQRVLFVGDSFSFVNGGVWRQYKTIAEACIPGLHVSYAQSSEGARTLAMASADPAARKLVHDMQYDILVVQDQSSLEELEEGLEAIKEWLSPAAKQHEALLGLYETWASPYMVNITAGTLWLKAFYEKAATIARGQGAEVAIARAGEAFLKFLDEECGHDWQDPAFHTLYAGDFQHPSYLGHNLVAWTMVLSFNAKRFEHGKGCDASRVPDVPGQSKDWKPTFARIACELSGVCSKQAKSSSHKELRGQALKLQGHWVRQRKLPLPQAQCNRTDHDCTYLEQWAINGTSVTQIGKSANWTLNGATLVTKERTHYLHVLDDDNVKMIPDMSFVKQISDNKVWFSDCVVLTRAEKADLSMVDECWCVDNAAWQDLDGRDCAWWESYVDKNNYDPSMYCNKLMNGHAAAMLSCPGCGKCSVPDERKEARQLTSVHI
eukprot:TRINITY_DN43651_c0_g1_i1.p1 TRINITY_DN43651_c0_g1~~TRINITY_DN43651_c0_g1_i1.p1  ORF type:complete len:466 (+),score=70.86 TRINITY_DN43651_c0_g1_i1:41-1399(+)